VLFRAKSTWEQFTTVGVVIELRPLRTRDGRLKYIDRAWLRPTDLPGFNARRRSGGPWYFFDVPADRLSRFQQAADAERASLESVPRRLDGHRQPRSPVKPGPPRTSECLISVIAALDLNQRHTGSKEFGSDLRQLSELPQTSTGAEEIRRP
jgi:PAS domain-containing protein